MDTVVWDDLTGCSVKSLVPLIQRADWKRHGLLFFTHSDPTGKLHRLLAKPKHFDMSQELDFSAYPAVTMELHRLAKCITEARTQALGEKECFLSPYLDSLDSLLSPNTAPDDIASKLSLSNRVDEHIDTGLFNIVLGQWQDLAALNLRLGPEDVVAVGDLLPEVICVNDLLGVVIPGYTWQLIDPRVPAVPHSAGAARAATAARNGLAQEQLVAGNARRRTLVLHWRVRGDYQIGGQHLHFLLRMFISVRDSEADVRENGRLRELYRPTIKPREDFILVIRTLTGTITELMAHPNWSVGNLLRALSDAKGYPITKMRLIFEGRQLENERKLSEYNLRAWATIHVVLPLRGD